MDPKKLLHADYLDIVYDQRNKNYGGYELRKNYSRRVKKGVGFLMLGVSAVVSFSFIPSREHIDTNNALHGPVEMTKVELPNTPPPPKPPTQYTPPPPPAKSVVYTKPVIMEDKDVTPDKQMAEMSKLKDANPGTTNNDSGVAGLNPPITGHGPAVAGPVTPSTPPPIPIFVEQMPSYDGDLIAYLSKHIVYPPNAREAGVEGRVGVQFVVNEDGSISNVRVVHGVGGGCDEEAIRVIKAMPRWKPGRNNGTAVKVLFTQPIVFKLQ